MGEDTHHIDGELMEQDRDRRYTVVLPRGLGEESTSVPTKVWKPFRSERHQSDAIC